MLRHSWGGFPYTQNFKQRSLAQWSVSFDRSNSAPGIGKIRDISKKPGYLQNQMKWMDEILHQLIGSLSHYFQRFIHPRWLFGISEPSTVSTGARFPLPTARKAKNNQDSMWVYHLLLLWLGGGFNASVPQRVYLWQIHYSQNWQKLETILFPYS